MTQYPFENLVFKGGGVKAAAYVGAAKALSEYGILKNITRIAGASSGAIFAALTAISEDHLQIKEMMDNLDYTKVQEKEPEHFPEELLPFKHLIDKHYGDAFCLFRLIEKYGWYSTEYFYNWIKEKINTAYGIITGISITKDTPVTFKDLYNAFNKELVLLGSNISRHKSYVFSRECTPDMEVAFAVRVSMSIPLYFEAQKFEYPGLDTTDFYGDGGVLRNYPLHIFDKDGIPNYKTIGCLLVLNDTENPRKEINNVVDFFENMVDTILSVQDNSYGFFDESDKKRTCYINDLGISTYKFNLTQTEKDNLAKSGEDAMIQFLENHSKNKNQ